MTDEDLDLLRQIWREHVPRSGQSSVVQGELLRCLAKLRDEATRNGNIDFGQQHLRLRDYVASVLLDAEIFDAGRLNTLAADLKTIGHATRPVLDDEVWDRLDRAVADWCRAHPLPLPKDHDPDLRI